jgi:hypothetical protein
VTGGELASEKLGPEWKGQSAGKGAVGKKRTDATVTPDSVPALDSKTTDSGGELVYTA